MRQEQFTPNKTLTVISFRLFGQLGVVDIIISGGSAGARLLRLIRHRLYAVKSRVCVSLCSFTCRSLCAQVIDGSVCFRNEDDDDEEASEDMASVFDGAAARVREWTATVH